MSAKTSISGFPELLPHERALENAVLSEVRSCFELFGFVDIETRAVEPVSALLSKGETSKEVYLLTRLQEPAVDMDSPKQLGLHFDLTVPFARYVFENAGHLQFPFRRTSIGKVWRGEKPQNGRFREFAQADVDIVNRSENGEELPIFHDVDIVKTVDYTLRRLERFNIPGATIQINNRKLLDGAYTVFGIKDKIGTMRTLDKMDKIGQTSVLNALLGSGEDELSAKKCLEFAKIVATTPEELLNNSLIKEVQVEDVAKRGLEELIHLLSAANAFHKMSAGENDARVLANLRTARGLDYYTGSVFETFLNGFENFGSIASGGRYDNLVGSIKGASSKTPKFPGVGMSIGITRLMSIILDVNSAPKKTVPTLVLVAVNSEQVRADSDFVVDYLRHKNISAISSPRAWKFGKQIEYAEKLGIEFVWSIDEHGNYSVKNITTKVQEEVDDSTFKDEVKLKKIFGKCVDDATFQVV
ncbi:MAG: histidine--tRNA ligase [Candidatus Ancillula trichonymphae]|nr:histidine--tRNA ligase [Candidatus Ancillula trichonymphae]